MTFDELNNRLDDFVIDLHNKEWLKEELKNCIIEENEYDINDTEDMDYTEKQCSTVESEIIVGLPFSEDDNYMMFGFKSEGFLDDQSLLEYIIHKYWIELYNLQLIDFVQESVVCIYTEDYSNDNCVEFRNRNKELNYFFSELIGKCLYNENSYDIKSTKDCKSFIESTFNISKECAKTLKRLSKKKFGNIEYRLFEDENSEKYTIVSYKNKLISYYNFDGLDFYD